MLEKKGIVASHSDGTNLFGSRHILCVLFIYGSKDSKNLSLGSRSQKLSYTYTTTIAIYTLPKSMSFYIFAL
jgi:hypothetical protein